MLTTFVLLAVVYVTARNLLLRDVNVRANNDIAQEVSEFRRFAAEGVDPTTSQPFVSVERMLEVYLARQTAGLGEVMAGKAGERIIELPGTGWPGDSPESRQLLDRVVTAIIPAGVFETPQGQLRWALENWKRSPTQP